MRPPCSWTKALDGADFSRSGRFPRHRANRRSVRRVPRPGVLHLPISAGLVGFGEIAADAIEIAKVLFFLFAASFVIRLCIGRGAA